MAFRTLISTTVLASHMDDPAYAIVDCRAKLDDLEWGAREHAKAHIPGAVYADLTHDLSGPKTGTNGRHPLPDPRALAQVFSRLGIASGVQVVAYDQENGMFASRLWWLLRWLGHDAVAVLDGGFKKWTAEDERPRAARPSAPRAISPEPPRAEMSIDVATVASRLGDDGPRLVDARAPERYRGDIEPIDKVGGHIPGAKNHFFQWNLDEQGLFRTPEELRAKISAIGRRRARGSDRVLLRIRRHRLPQPARVRARRDDGSEALCGLVVARWLLPSRRPGAPYAPSVDET